MSILVPCHGSNPPSRAPPFLSFSRFSFFLFNRRDERERERPRGGRGAERSYTQAQGWAAPVFCSPSLNSNKISDNKEVKKWVENYLGVGEWVMDQSVAVLGSSSWFERKR